MRSPIGDDAYEWGGTRLLDKLHTRGRRRSIATYQLSCKCSGRATQVLGDASGLPTYVCPNTLSFSCGSGGF